MAEEEQFHCPGCANNGVESVMEEVVEGRYHCANCGTTVEAPDAPILPRIFHDAQENAEEIAHQVFEPQVIELPTPTLRRQFEDAWFNLVCGRFNAAIVLTNVFIEALIKEVIWVHDDRRLQGSLNTVIEYCEAHEILNRDEINYLKHVRENTRNKWLHQDLVQMVAGRTVTALPINIYEEMQDGENILDALERVQEELRGGGLQMQEIDPAENPALANMAALQAAKDIAGPLYQSVWDFTNHIVVRYLKSKHYSAHHGRMA